MFYGLFESVKKRTVHEGGIFRKWSESKYRITSDVQILSSTQKFNLGSTQKTQNGLKLKITQRNF